MTTLTIGQHMRLPWNTPNTRFYQPVANIANFFDLLNSLIPFEVACCDVGPTFDDFVDWLRRAEKAGLINSGEYMDCVKAVDCVAYNWTCRR